MRVLLVEDEVRLAENLSAALNDAAGYAVDWAGDGADGDDLARGGCYGLSVLGRIRARKDSTPVLILTAKEGKDAIVQLLNAGADDYLSKPFDLGELLARAKALIRRGKGAAHPVLSVLDVEVNTLEQTVHRAGALVDLSPTEYRILEYLAHHPRKIVSQRELLEHLYDYNWEHHSNVIEAHVSNLRKRLQAAAPNGEAVIQTLRGRGYRIATANQAANEWEP
jgi:two-component system response regulator PhoP